MPVNSIFTRSIDSMYQRLGKDAQYNNHLTSPFLIRVIDRRPEKLLSLGEDRIHAEDPHMEFRVSEVPSPVRGDEIILEGKSYQIEEEPRLDQHQLVWHTETLPV